MAPKTFMYIALIFFGIFVCNIPAVCLTQSSDKTGICSEIQAQKDHTVGQKIAAKEFLQGVLRDPRDFVRFKSRAMYADNVKFITADAMAALHGPVGLEEGKEAITMVVI